MFCPKCGTSNDDTARFCRSCGQDMGVYSAQGGQPPAQQPPPYQPPYQQPYQPPVQQVTVYQQPNQQGGYPGGVMPHVSSYMAWAIICIFLFWPGAIAAIVYASRVGNRLSIGDFYGAQAASRSAKTWCWVCTIIAIVWIVILIIGAAAGWYATRVGVY